MSMHDQFLLPVSRDLKPLEKGPGVIHFDVSEGCTVETLNGALLHLGLPLDLAVQTFEQLGLGYIVPALCWETKGQVQGCWLDLGVMDDWLGKKSGTFDDLQSCIKSADMPPAMRALVEKTLSLLSQSLKKSCGRDASAAAISIKSSELIRILCSIIVFCALIQAANPLAVSASRLSISWPPFFKPSTTADVGIDKNGWLLALMEGLPTYEQEWPAPFVDPVAVALLKVVASHFGARGESLLLRSGIGVESKLAFKVLTRALWCEPAMILTRATLGPSAEVKVQPAVQIEGLLGAGVDVQNLIRCLTHLGARSIWTTPVMQQGAFFKNRLSLVTSHADIEKIMEVMLVEGEASEISSLRIEEHRLRQRTVSIPFGRGPKTQYCGVTEWLLGEKIVRAEPVGPDLASIATTTGFAQEVVRGDVVAAWKKWRVENL